MTDKSYSIIQGDALESLSMFPNNHFDSLFSDPPYGLSPDKKAKKGFMGNEWDSAVPNVKFWKEVYRVMKPGATIMAFGGSRTYHRLAVAIEDAGFQIRDGICAWHYKSGFPHSYNIGLKLPMFDGYQTALKPSFEPIIVAQKPVEKNNVYNAEKWGVAGLNLGNCRIGNDTFVINTFDNGAKPFGNAVGENYTSRISKGRYPANTVFVNHTEYEDYFFCAKANKKEKNVGLETMPTRGKVFNGQSKKSSKYKVYSVEDKFTTKPSANHHPCVKPIELCKYFTTMLLPPGNNSKILVPFSGSGSEMIGAMLSGWKEIIGLEQDHDYIEIAERRLQFWIEKSEEYKTTDVKEILKKC